MLDALIAVEPLPEDIDPRLAYIVMLNGMEESELREVLWDLRPRGFVADAVLLPTAQRALRYLVASGWLDVTAVTRCGVGNPRILEGDEREWAISAADSWVDPSDDQTTLVGLLPTDKGIEAWRVGFPALGLSERARAELMFPQYRGEAGDGPAGV